MMKVGLYISSKFHLRVSDPDLEGKRRKSRPYVRTPEKHLSPSLRPEIECQGETLGKGIIFPLLFTFSFVTEKAT